MESLARSRLVLESVKPKLAEGRRVRGWKWIAVTIAAGKL